MVRAIVRAQFGLFEVEELDVAHIFSKQLAYEWERLGACG